MPQTGQPAEAITVTPVNGETIYNTFNGTIGPPGTVVGGAGATATLGVDGQSPTPSPGSGFTDYTIRGFASVSCQVAIRVIANGIIVGSFAATAAGGGLGGYLSAGPPRWNGRHVEVDVTVLASAGTIGAFVLAVVADVDVYTRTTTGGRTGTPPAAELAQTGFLNGWHRGHRPSDAPYHTLGVKVEATRAWLGWAGRRVVFQALDLTVTATDDPPSVLEDRIETFSRYPGSTTDDDNAYFTIGRSRIGGPARIRPG